MGSCNLRFHFFNLKTTIMLTHRKLLLKDGVSAGRVLVHDVTGRILYSGDLTSTVDMKQFSAGVYS